MRSWSWTAPSSTGESLSECAGCDLPEEEMLQTLWILLNQLEKVHGRGCSYPQGHHLRCMQASSTACRDPGISIQEIIPFPFRVPCLEAVGLQAVCQQHWNHAAEVEVHRNGWKVPHYVESEAESSLWGKVGHLGYASDVAPNFHAFGLEGCFCLCDKFHKFSIVPELVGDEDVIGVFPCLIGLCGKPPPDPLVSANIRVEHISNASHLAGHAPGIYGLMGSGLGRDLLCHLEGGEALELLGHFHMEILALCDQLVDLSCLFLA